MGAPASSPADRAPSRRPRRRDAARSAAETAAFRCTGAERLNVKSDRRLHIRQRLLIGVALTDNHTLQSNRIRNVPVGMLLDDDFDLPHDYDAICRTSLILDRSFSVTAIPRNSEAVFSNSVTIASTAW